ncbi:MAG TPA: hypothetical protein VMU84_01245 [Thermoanaerobaculia bacterium]|nr:hypothetical protein [Thermoanaerobaculia bacterium]
MKRTLIAIAMLCAAAAASAKCAPKNVLKFIVSNDLPVSTTRTLYRQGEKFGRYELPGVLIIVSEPDLWVVNKVEKTGQHALDPDDSSVFHAVVLDDSESKYWNNFEFGCEVPFMHAVGAEPKDGVYEHTAEGVTVRLTVAKSGIPQRIDVKTPKSSYSMIYHAWEELRDAPPDLFAKPEGITFTEQSAEPDKP